MVGCGWPVLFLSCFQLVLLVQVIALFFYSFWQLLVLYVSLVNLRVYS